MPEQPAPRLDQGPSGRRLLGWLRRCPLVVPVILVPSWVTWLVVERDLEDTGHPLFYHIPDLFRDRWRCLSASP